MIDKFVRSVAEAMAGIKDGSTVLIAGFAQVGEPRALIDGLIEQGARDLTVVHNTAGRGREGVARLIGEGRVRKIVCSFARSRGSVIFEEVFARGGIELEILPQGTMAERMRAAAAGIPAFYTATAAGTKLAEGKESRSFNGREIDDRPSGCAEGIRQSLHLGNGARQERYVDLGFGMFAGHVAEAAVSMQKVVLHIDDEEGGFLDFRAAG